MKAGADDYLIKPFSAQELIARVAAHLGMARMRRESAQRERAFSDAALAIDRQAAKVLESINDGFCTLDSEWRFTSINPAAYRMAPTLADALGNSLFDIFPGTRGTIVEDNLYRCVREQTVIEFEFHYEPHGRWYQNRYFGIAGLGVAIVWTDITVRRLAEQNLQKKTELLLRSNDELELFTSIASHDLQEPLRMISSYCDILGKRYASIFDEKAKEYFGRITAGAERMRALIHALISYSQVDKEALNLTESPARAVADDAMEHLLPEITVMRAQMSIGALPTVVGDRARLTQLFQNLIANALKFSAADRAPLVSITAVEDGEWWRFSVTDNGIGISAAGQEKIFHMFQRLHAADRYPGSGIGLATCKKIVEQHGGRIWVESEAGVGSTFCFTLPKRLTVSQEQA